MRFKRAAKLCALCAGIILLTIQPRTGMNAALSGLKIWSTALVPALFPYCFLAISLERMGFGRLLGRYLGWFMRIFGCPAQGAGVFICGWLGGNPTGAKLTAICAGDPSGSAAQFTQLAWLSAACSPAFALGTMENALPGCGWPLLISCWLGLLSGSLLLRFCQNAAGHARKNSRNVLHSAAQKNPPGSAASPLSPALDAARAMLLIGCWVILFSVLSAYIYYIALLCGPYVPPLPLAFVHSLLEMAGGSLALAELAQGSMRQIVLPLIAFALTFGGMSISMQALAFLRPVSISAANYLGGKIVQGACAALCCRFWIGLGTVETFAAQSQLKFSELDESQTVPALVTLALGIIAALLNRRYLAYDKKLHSPKP